MVQQRVTKKAFTLIERVGSLIDACQRRKIFKTKIFFTFRYTFIDLAQIVCKLPETRHEKMESSSSSDEEYDGYISEPTTLVRNILLFLRIDKLFFTKKFSPSPTESQFIDARIESSYWIVVVIRKRNGLRWIWISVTTIVTTVGNDIVDIIVTKWHKIVCIAWPFIERSGLLDVFLSHFLGLKIMKKNSFLFNEADFFFKLNEMNNKKRNRNWVNKLL